MWIGLTVLQKCIKKIHSNILKKNVEFNSIYVYFSCERKTENCVIHQNVICLHNTL